MRTWSEVQSLVGDPQRLGAAVIRRLRSAIGLDEESPLLPKSPIGPWIRLLHGAWVHMRTGETPQSAHLALIALFIRSGGRANDLLSRAVGILHPPYRLPRASGVLGDLTAGDLARIERQLEIDGYYVFENCLSAEFCERVVRQTLALDCVLAGDEVAAQQGSDSRGRYDRGGPSVAALYQLTREDTTDLAEVQELVSDPSIITVAQNYLKSKPIFTGITMRWSPPVKDAPDSVAAQEFHWDMERIRWIRFFIYLTDVTADSGPHCFISGSHRTGAIPKDLLEQGYVRQKDEILLQRYGNEAYREFTGPRGTIVAEDSRGWHKGKPPRRGDRLLLAFELCNTTFGANKRHVIRNIRVARFGDFAKKFPRLYANFDFASGVLR
jgi:ectoine hydroxylase-related dioxygenase (phytanoyl-CoA dioxygenase family)